MCRRIIRLVCFFVLSFSYFVSAQDLPHPAANIETIPAGSYIIPMDNDHQSIVPAGQAPFNLKAYGLVNKFLQNGIPVKWAIKSGKPLDGIDFSATVDRIAPSATSNETLDFRGGPFIVPDTTLPCGVSSIQLITEWGNNVAAYKLVQATAVDVRYTVTHRPKIAVFTNGGNELLQTKILDAAGIGDYHTIDAKDIDTISYCYTFASEAHAGRDRITANVATAVKNFVAGGGNFLSQCEAIDSYEFANLFHSDNGISALAMNATITNAYPNPDLAFSQFHGEVQSNPNGSISKWTLANGSSWRSYYYPVVSDGADIIAAAGAHTIAPNAPGGNVFYLGGHDFGRLTPMGGVPTDEMDLTDIQRINGLRMYLNAVFIPSGSKKVAWVTVGAPIVSVTCGDRNLQMKQQMQLPGNGTLVILQAATAIRPVYKIPPTPLASRGRFRYH